MLIRFKHDDPMTVKSALSDLVESGMVFRTLLAEAAIRVEPASGEEEEALYLAQGCFIPRGTEGGWEAALFDHYQACSRRS